VHFVSWRVKRRRQNAKSLAQINNKRETKQFPSKKRKNNNTNWLGLSKWYESNIMQGLLFLRYFNFQNRIFALQASSSNQIDLITFSRLQKSFSNFESNRSSKDSTFFLWNNRRYYRTSTLSPLALSCAACWSQNQVGLVAPTSLNEWLESFLGRILPQHLKANNALSDR
jgi:hypothetical protein